MTRKDRDEFRIGLDNLLRDLLTPEPPYHRFDSPVFNPVLRHPNDDLVTEPEHFVIRLDIKVPETDKDVIYTVKRSVSTANRERYRKEKS